METMKRVRNGLYLKLLAGTTIGLLLSTCLFPSTTCPTPVHRPAKRQQSLYIGVMSAQKFLSERVMAALETWARGVDARVEIFAQFASSNRSSHPMRRNLKGGHTLIALPGVKDNAYPPQKKSFSVVKHMYDHYIDKYDWFLRLDDDAYVNVDKLVRFLSRLNSSKPVYIGNAGYGADKGDRVPPGENYCMGGPGVIMSRGLLRLLGPRLKSCLGRLYTEHEDIEFGRCVTRVAGIRCTSAHDTVDLFYQHFDARGVHPSDISHLSTRIVDDALIFHCNKHRAPQLSLHNNVLKRRAEELARKIDRIHKELSQWKASPHAPVKNPQYQQAVYTAYSRGLSYLVGPYPKENLHPTDRILNKIVMKKVLAKAYKTFTRRVRCDSIQTYINPRPLNWLDFHAHAACIVTTSTITKRHEFRFSLKQGFTRVASFMNEHRPLDVALTQRARKLKCEDGTDCGTTHVPVYFILSLSDRKSNFERFLNSFEDNFLSQDDNVHLHVCQFCRGQSSCSESESGFDAAAHVARLRLRHPRATLQAHKMPTGDAFSRGVGLQTCANMVKDDGAILYFVDVDLVFQPELLIHIRRNTVRHSRVFYPTFFSQFDPRLGDVTNGIEEANGFWRYFSYGMLAVYKSDFAKTSGFDLKLKGWGLEDDHMLDTIIRNRLDIFRSMEPAQFHIFHDKLCSKSLTSLQYGSCQRSRAEHMGSKRTLYDIYFNKHASKSRFFRA